MPVRRPAVFVKRKLAKLEIILNNRKQKPADLMTEELLLIDDWESKGKEKNDV